ILSLGAGGSTKMVGGGLIRRAFNAKYPREYIDLAEKRSANLAAFADFYREPEEHT
ncbi:MAG: coproporphyrinogen dehydrogenase HemZ, partial [Clostridiales bacterium]|nr:coproporphyrinogen dehydrogenase HemZ [Clostridiales bacterium]